MMDNARWIDLIYPAKEWVKLHRCVMVWRQDESGPHDPRHCEHVNKRCKIKCRAGTSVQDPGTQDNHLVQHTRRHLQEIHDPGSGSHSPLKFELRQFICGYVTDGCWEEDLGENGHDGGDGCGEEREEEDGRGDYGERSGYKPFFDVPDILWAERLPQ